MTPKSDASPGPTPLNPTPPGPTPPGPNPPDELRPFLVYLLSERGLAHNTHEAYRRDLTDLLNWLNDPARPKPDGRADPRALATAEADDYRAYLQQQTRDKQSTRTVARRLAAVRAFLKFLLLTGVDRSHVLQQLDRPKPESTLPKILSRDWVNELIAAPDPASRLYARDVAILELLYAAGLRASELCGMSVADANLTVGFVRVMGKGSKERIVPVGQAAIATIGRYLAENRPTLLGERRCDRLFLSKSGRPFDRVSLWMLVERHAKMAGILKRVSPHTLRHCFATHLIGGGADLRVVQELLGHADVATTQIYTHVDTDRLRAVHKKFHPRG